MPADAADAGDRRRCRDEPSGRIKVAIVGRPNVGKSTLVNTLLGEERVIAFDQPGTTRDSIYLDFERDGRRYTLIDTAGVRRRGKVFEAIEKFSVIKTLQAIEDANVVVLLLDARAGHLRAGRAPRRLHPRGRAARWSSASTSGTAVPADRRDDVKRELDRKLGFLVVRPAPLHLGARTARGVAGADALGRRAPTPRRWRGCRRRSSRGRCTPAVERQQPPRAGMGRPKLRYAHQGGENPPLIVIHGTALGHVPDAYRRYLEHFFSDAFQLRGTPLRIQFKTGANPYADAPDAPQGPLKRRACGPKLGPGGVPQCPRGGLPTAARTTTNAEHAMSNKGQMLQDPFLNTLRKEHVQVSIYLVNGIKLQGQIESFDQYVVLLKNTVTQMVYKHAISTVVPARAVAMPHHAPSGDSEG